MQYNQQINRLLKVILITSLFILFYNKINCQVIHQIYRDDTCFIKSSLETHKFYYYSFKDSLPDGKWIIYNVNRKDSLSNRKKIISRGIFKDNKKDGLFEMYNLSLINNKESILYYFCNYKKGKKHGTEEEYYISEDTMHKNLWFHGEYFNGKEDGCFTYIEKDGRISYQIQYEDGLMKHHVMYAGVKASRYREIEVIANNSFKYSQYLFNDTIFKIVYYINNGILENIDLFNNDKKIVKSRQCNIKVSPFNKYFQTSRKIIQLDKEILMNDTLYFKYLKENQ